MRSARRFSVSDAPSVYLTLVTKMSLGVLMVRMELLLPRTLSEEEREPVISKFLDLPDLLAFIFHILGSRIAAMLLLRAATTTLSSRFVVVVVVVVVGLQNLLA